MKKLLPILIFQFLLIGYLQAQDKREVIGRDIGSLKNLNISGRIIDEITGDALVGATVTVRELNKTEVTGTNGTFSFVLDRAEYILEFRYVGYETIIYPIVAVGDGRINITMIQEDFTLDDVVIFGRDPEKNIRSTEMGAISISMNQLKELPRF